MRLNNASLFLKVATIIFLSLLQREREFIHKLRVSLQLNSCIVTSRGPVSSCIYTVILRVAVAYVHAIRITVAS